MSLEHKSTLRGVIEFHRARLVALDNWGDAQAAVLSADPVGEVSRTLEVSDLGAHSVIAMLRGQRPERAQVERKVRALERLQVLSETDALRRKRTLARCPGVRHVLA